MLSYFLIYSLINFFTQPGNSLMYHLVSYSNLLPSLVLQIAHNTIKRNFLMLVANPDASFLIIFVNSLRIPYKVF